MVSNLRRERSEAVHTPLDVVDPLRDREEAEVTQIADIRPFEGSMAGHVATLEANGYGGNDGWSTG